MKNCSLGNVNSCRCLTSECSGLLGSTESALTLINHLQITSPNSLGKNSPPSFSRIFFSVTESTITELQHVKNKMASETPVRRWCSGSGRTRWWLPGKDTSKGTWVSLAWKFDSTSCCWVCIYHIASAAASWRSHTQKPPNSQLSLTYGEAACTGDSVSHRMGKQKQAVCHFLLGVNCKNVFINPVTHAWGEVRGNNILASFISTWRS